LFDQVADDWGLDDEHRDWLKWCARVHEVGLSIAHSLHHHHGAYLVANSDLFGFTTEEQQTLAFIVRAQRRAVPVELLGTLPARLAGPAWRLAVLLRLAALLHRSRTSEALPPLRLSVGAKGLRLDLPREWLAKRPLTANDLDQERKHLAALDITLKVGHDVAGRSADPPPGDEEN
jgi:exopolyphosphatase/guanosine-5'-triphosphate,3'-diphosphate pyrophosphatase